MNSFFTNQLIFNQQPYVGNQYWNMPQFMNIQHPYVHNYYNQPYTHYSQPLLFYQNRSQNQQEQVYCKEESITAQGTIRAIYENKDQNQQYQTFDSPKITNEILEKYIHLIINEDESSAAIIAQLKKNNQINLSDILEKLIKKQRLQAKSREELIKFCLRKALKFIFKKIQEENDKSKTNLKTAQKIFLDTIESETKSNIMLPFRKNSKNKTMNSDFLREIFSSKTFFNYYQEFLNCLEKEIQNDSKKKIASLCNKIMNHLSDDKIISFEVKRLPWSHANIEKVKQTAQEMIFYSKIKNE